MHNLTCHLHMLILAGPRDPSTFRKSLEEWKGQAHPHSRMSSQLSHISGMNTDTYLTGLLHTQVLWELAHGAWKPGTPPHWGGILPPQLVLLVGAEASLCLTSDLGEVGHVRGAGENGRPPLITWILRGLPWEPGPLLTAITHTSLNGHTPCGLVAEQLFGLLVWSSQPSVEDGLPNPRKLRVQVSLMFSH